MKVLVIAFLTFVLVIATWLDYARPASSTRDFWHTVVMPGALSQSHASLAHNCVACHQPVKGVNSASCINCHANNKDLLQRQPTAFHASLQTCTGCHVEHQGGARMPTQMDHTWLAKVGHQSLRKLGVNVASGTLTNDDIETLTKSLGQSRLNSQTREEQGHQVPGPVVNLNAPTLQFSPHSSSGDGGKLLNCVACHATKDRHQQVFGKSCAQCHALDTWSITEFRHPSVRSTDCAQCHKAPPSHGMMHFSMISQPLAGQYKAQVNQCYLCHQTTTWNDIKGSGWLKHH
jgi:hypothetical protein